MKTGEVIGYIGECHTHPMDLETLSGTDLNTIELLKEINKKTPIPTCAIIITQTKFCLLFMNKNDITKKRLGLALSGGGYRQLHFI